MKAGTFVRLARTGGATRAMLDHGIDRLYRTPAERVRPRESVKLG
jgi:hypothetical protein